MKMDFSKDVDLVALLKVDCQLTEDEEEDLAEMGHGNMFKILKIMLNGVANGERVLHAGIVKLIVCL